MRSCSQLIYSRKAERQAPGLNKSAISNEPPNCDLQLASPVLRWREKWLLREREERRERRASPTSGAKKKKKRDAALLKTLPPSNNCESLTWLSWRMWRCDKHQNSWKNNSDTQSPTYSGKKERGYSCVPCALRSMLVWGICCCRKWKFSS